MSNVEVEQATGSRTRTLAWIIGAAALLLPLAVLSFGYPQWVFYPSQGPCYAFGTETWYLLGRAVGGAVALAILGLAIFGCIRGGAARVAGTLTISLVVGLFLIVTFASYYLFHIAAGPCA